MRAYDDLKGGIAFTTAGKNIELFLTYKKTCIDEQDELR